MTIIKFILAVIGIFFAGFVALWILGWLSSLLWYVFWIGLLGGAAYGAYRLFTKVEKRVLGADPREGLGSGDINMSWDEYDKKYLHR